MTVAKGQQANTDPVEASEETTESTTKENESTDTVTRSEGSQATATRHDTDGGRETRADERSRFLVGLDYDSRAERRRVEYRLDNWDGHVEKLPRMARILEGDDFYDLYDELQETVDDDDHLYVYELEDITPSTQERTVRIDRAFDEELDRLEWAVHSLLNKRNVTELGDTTYEIHAESSDVTVTLEYKLTNVERGARLELTLTGPTPAPNAMKDALLRDLGYLLPEPKEVFDE